MKNMREPQTLLRSGLSFDRVADSEISILTTVQNIKMILELDVAGRVVSNALFGAVITKKLEWRHTIRFVCELL